ncbi:MAG: DUF177 domain-containing protein [Bdellovibrionota bacterium]
MKIRLNEIPAEGRSYTFDRKTGELNADVGDLVGTHDYSVQMNINPIGNAYEMRGKLKTTLDEVCSKCGEEFAMPIEKSFHEILFEEPEDHRKSHSVNGNHSVDFANPETVSMTPVKGDIFDPGAFTHEAIGLAEPFYPLCGPNGTCLHAEEVAQTLSKLEQDWLAAEEKRTGHPAFSVLAGVDLTRNKN